MGYMKSLLIERIESGKTNNTQARCFQSACLTAALEYASRGLAVFPVNGKVPFRGSHGYKDATTDPERVRALFKGKPRANVAIATGKTSGVFVIDVDPRNDGDETFSNLLGSSVVPQTWRAITGGGGRHYFFKYIEGIKYVTKMGDGVDVKSDGGYVVAAPSKHPTTGKRYAWDSSAQINGPLASIDTERFRVARPDRRSADHERNQRAHSQSGARRRISLERFAPSVQRRLST